MLDRIQDFRIYSMPWWISVVVLFALAALLTLGILLGVMDLIRFGGTNAALTIDENGIILPFTDPKSVISWDNIESYEREDARYSRSGPASYLYVTLRQVRRSWGNPFKKSKIMILGCYMSADDDMDRAMALIDKYYVWK